MDFVYDQLASGRRFRVLNVIDDFNRELIGQLTAFSISGLQVARFLSQLEKLHGLPKQIVCDNGTEFTSKAMFFGQKRMASSCLSFNLANQHKTLLSKALTENLETNV